ncbi:unnamed protein product [Allacma fusca]|uniref:Uncharacterized protein n=1 Tax=Allacma fusca TaxID=39272 RepID=A0A8J2LV59_9HEXA|nr:unnamed protein product [Allacma fusca]
MFRNKDKIKERNKTLFRNYIRIPNGQRFEKSATGNGNATGVKHASEMFLRIKLPFICSFTSFRSVITYRTVCSGKGISVHEVK